MEPMIWNESNWDESIWASDECESKIHHIAYETECEEIEGE